MPMTVSETPGTIEAIFPADGANRKLPSVRLEMVAYFSFPGKTLITPDHVILAFRSLSQDEVKFASDRQLIVTADGSRLNLGEMLVTDRRVDSGIQMRDTTFYRETLELPVPYESFVNVANATKVNMRVGKTEFELSTDQRESLRVLAKKIQK
jgi:hypothetical protein